MTRRDAREGWGDEWLHGWTLEPREPGPADTNAAHAVVLGLLDDLRAYLGD